MSTELFMRGLFALIMSGCFCWAIHRNKAVEDTFDPEGKHQRYLPFVSGIVLPVFVFMTAAVMLLVRPEGTAQSLLSMFFSLFVHISLYYLVLLALLPFLRRHFSATACAALWLIPNYLYLTQQNYMELPAPALVLRLPMGAAGVLLAVWGVGAAAVMAFKIVSHLRFRRQVLAHARAEEDQAVLAVWNTEVEAARFQKPKFRLVRSSVVSSPLSIGLFERTTRVVLPEKTYSPEELALIFRHELVHIGRQDAWSKFFLAFCAAMCWFNPLMWLAMGKSADDLELSCDEAVLQNETDARRRQYAGLLLTTAGDGRGFTTCLSTGAKAMRYRLKSVVKPAQKFTGGVLVGVVFFVLCMTSGYVTLAFDAGSGAEVFFDGQDPAACTIASVRNWKDEGQEELLCLDESGFSAFLAELPLDRLTGNYSFTDGTRETIVIWDTPKGTLSTVFYEKVIKVVPFYTEDMEAFWYSVSGGMEWERFDSFFEPQPALDLVFEDENGERFSDINASLWRLEQGGTVLTDRTAEPEEDVSGIFGYEEAERVRFAFSLPARDVRFTIEPESGAPYSVHLTEEGVLMLADDPALYRVAATLEGSRGAYKAEFRFAVGDVE